MLAPLDRGLFSPGDIIPSMLAPVNADEEVIAARLLDFFAAATPWNRRLWNTGLVLGLREILEATEAARAGL